MDADLEATLRARIGTTLGGKWRLQRVLGVGGMAAVYAARHRNASRAAVKILHPALAHDAGIRKRFLREGYVANTVEHPGAVRVLDDDVAADGTVFLVMELLEGETLESRAVKAGGILSASDVLSLADQLLDVLAAAHEKGILHRDIKPENVFLTLEGRVKVLDFGIARVRDAAKSSVTQAGMTVGTPAFMSPEQAMGRASEIGPRSDLWAVGATMYFLLTGRFVHLGESSNEVLVRAATQPAPLLSATAPHVPSVVADVVDRALAFDSSRRWSDAHDFQLAVRRAHQTLVGDAGAAPLLPPVVTRRGDGPDESATLPAHPMPIPSPAQATHPAVTRNSPPGDIPPARPRSLLLAGVAALVVASLPVAYYVSTRRPVLVTAPSPADAASLPDGGHGADAGNSASVPTAMESTSAPSPAASFAPFPAVKAPPWSAPSARPPSPKSPPAPGTKKPPATMFDRQD